MVEHRLLNRHGQATTFRLERDLIQRLMATPFVTATGECPQGQEEEQPLSLLRTRNSYDLWLQVPDGRHLFADFGGNPRQVAWAKDLLVGKFGKQFPTRTLNLWVPCKCSTHWRPLQDEDFMSPGQDLCAIAVPQALGVLRGMVPELPTADTMVPLGRVLARASTTRPQVPGTARPAESKGPPPSKVKKPQEPPKKPHRTSYPQGCRPQHPRGPPPKYAKGPPSQKRPLVDKPHDAPNIAAPVLVSKSSRTRRPKALKTEEQQIHDEAKDEGDAAHEHSQATARPVEPEPDSATPGSHQTSATQALRRRRQTGPALLQKQRRKRTWKQTGTRRRRKSTSQRRKTAWPTQPPSFKRSQRRVRTRTWTWRRPHTLGPSWRERTTWR